jgi:hypothetical protein
MSQSAAIVNPSFTSSPDAVMPYAGSEGCLPVLSNPAV